MKAINSFLDFEELFGIEHLKKEEVGLTNMENFLASLGNPENDLKNIIHIAGTNGKGSTSAALESILEAHGMSVALHTSPHLVSYTERFRINKQPISETELIETLNTIYHHKEKTGLFISLFEALTIAAILIFKNHETEYAIFETGLGGRLDATNVLPAKTHILTHIDLDHTDRLGETIKEIAFEKASIIKEESIVISSNTEDAAKVIEKFAEKNNATLVSPENFSIQNSSISEKGTTFELERKEKYTLSTNLIGHHQAENSSLAFIAAQGLLDGTFETNKALEGLESIIWPARFHILQESPKIILDGAHNQNSIEALLKTLDDTNTIPKHVYFASKKGKDFSFAINAFLKRGCEITLVDVEHFLLDTPAISKAFPSLPSISLKELIKEIFQTKKDPALITGSLYFIGEFLKESKIPFPFEQ